MSFLQRCLRIATRKSPLAMIQAEWVASKLKAHHPSLSIKFVGLTTAGDRHLSSPLWNHGGKGLFIKELEEALLENKADIAVHSMKDMTSEIAPGLSVPVICERADPRDVLLTNNGFDLFSLKKGARVGSSSLRRQCQILSFRPDLEVIPLRGNVNTRLNKLEAGEFDALILAVAGLERLQLSERIHCPLSTEVCLPAAGQGAIGIECREDAPLLHALIAPLNDCPSFYAVTAERRFSACLNGGCRAPIAALAEAKGERLLMRGLVGRPDGSLILRSQKTGLMKDAKELGEALAQALLHQGAGDIIAAL